MNFSANGYVIINTGLQTMHSIKVCCGLHKFNKDWDTVPSSQHSDAVAGNGGGVKRTPAEADSGVSDVDEAKVSYFGHIWRREGTRDPTQKDGVSHLTRKQNLHGSYCEY